jgi:hypothetical protein
MKDLKLCPKTGNNYGGGDLDFQYKEGKLMLVEGNNVIPQAVLKMTIASVNKYNSYGAAIKEFRGSKEIVPLRIAVIARILRGVDLISKWYSVPIELKDFDIIQEPTASDFHIRMKINEELVTV